MTERAVTRLDRSGLVVVILMAVSAAIVLFRFGVDIARGIAADPPLWVGWFVGVILVGLVSAGIPLLAAWLVVRGARIAPVVVTLVGVWDASTVLSGGDALAWVSAVLSVVVIVVAWLPSTRRNAADRRAERLRRRDRRFTPRGMAGSRGFSR